MLPIETYEIPLLHPLVVHFPIVLILVGAVAVVTWAVRDSVFWHHVATLAFGVGAASAFLAYLTGEDARHASEDVPIVEDVVELHEDLAIITLFAAAITLVALLIANLWRHESPDRSHVAAVRWTIAALAVTAGVLVAWTAHLGGIMVWGVPR